MAGSRGRLLIRSPVDWWRNLVSPLSRPKITIYSMREVAQEKRKSSGLSRAPSLFQGSLRKEEYCVCFRTRHALVGELGLLWFVFRWVYFTLDWPGTLITGRLRNFKAFPKLEIVLSSWRSATNGTNFGDKETLLTSQYPLFELYGVTGKWRLKLTSDGLSKH